MSTIKELREKTGLSQGKFSQFTGIPVQSIQNWEAGRRTPPDYLIKLLECYIENNDIPTIKDGRKKE